MMELRVSSDSENENQLLDEEESKSNYLQESVKKVNF